MFHWNNSYTEKEVEVDDLTIVIVDKDDASHSIKREGVYWWEQPYEEPTACDTADIATRFIERHEYLCTDAGLHIPRCNIKNVKFKDQKKRVVVASWEHLGIRNWGTFEWLSFLFVAGCVTVFLAFIAFCIYSKLHGKM